jgi:hypothetical protein
MPDMEVGWMDMGWLWDGYGGTGGWHEDAGAGTLAISSTAYSTQ